MQLMVHAWFEPEMLVGTEARSYKLEKVVGFGGFGAVYLTKSSQGDPRAVKVLYPPHSRSSQDLQAWADRAAHFLREVQIVAQFHHKNIIKIYDTGYLYWSFDDPLKGQQGHQDRSGDYLLPFYVTEYIPDGLDRHVRGDQLFDAKEVVRTGAQICDGLAEIHGSNPRIIHRDLNPGDIRLAEGRGAVITDFGVARFVGVPVTTEIIPPDVAAPEQLLGKEPDVRTDIYQVGALLFALLTGKFPRAGDVPSLLTSKGVPKDVDRVIRQCLEFERERRFQDVVSLRTALLKARLSPPWRLFILPARLLGRQVYGWVVEQAAGYVPPVWRKPAFWLLAFPLALIVAIVVLRGVDCSNPLLFGWSCPPPKPIEITMASSSTKKEWVNQAVKAFNEDSQTNPQLQVDGRPVHVEVLLEEEEPGVFDHYRSGAMVSDILNHKIEPTIASPAEQSWIQKVRAEWGGSKAEKSWSSKLGRDLSSAVVTSGEAPGLLRTPLVIAMWQSRAVALDCWPTASANCTWETLRALASSTDGWGMFGHPEWGKLKYGYGFPGKSNSATFTEVLNCMSGMKVRKGLTLDDVYADSLCGEGIAALEKARIRIFDRSQRALREMRIRGPEYLDAVTSYERKVVEVNVIYRAMLSEPIVAVYPQDGTIMATHPLAILDGAPWVDSVQAEAAAVFLKFLLSEQQQSRLVDDGFRPTDPAKPLGPPIDPSNGVDPEADLVLVEVPGTQAIRDIVALWTCIRLGDCPR